jgi:YD repeat-containing protein
MLRRQRLGWAGSFRGPRHSGERAPGRLSRLENRKKDATVISRFEFARDANGNITRSLREDGSCWYYAYDGLQRLTRADWKDAGGATLYAFEYAYDKVGNRLRFAQNGVSTYYSYNEANELVSEVTPGVETAYYTYDGRGNQITRSVLAGHTTYFSYNSRNLVSGISNTDPTFTPNYFEYNALGQRIKKVDSTGTTRYLWDGLNILLETDASGNLTRRYTHGYTPIEGVSSLIAVEGPIQCPCFYHFDQVGGVRHLTDPYHNTIKSYAYEPFGRILAEAGAAPNDFTFPATYVQLSDLPTLRVSPARVYDGARGTYVERDPQARTPQFAALAGNPARLVDASGRRPVGPDETGDMSGGAGLSGGTWGAPYQTPAALLEPGQVMWNPPGPWGWWSEKRGPKPTTYDYLGYPGYWPAYFKNGDTIRNTSVGTIGVTSDDLQGGKDRTYLAGVCVLKALGMILPEARNGLYWGDFEHKGGREGTTIIVKGAGLFGLTTRAYSFISELGQRHTEWSASGSAAAFWNFLRSLWWEVKGRNFDRFEGDEGAPRYQAEVDAKWREAEGKKVPQGICCEYTGKTGKTVVPIANELERIQCECGVRYSNKGPVVYAGDTAKVVGR